MIQLTVLSGASAGKTVALKKFPVTVGRGAANSVQLSDTGVFEKHFEIRFSDAGFTMVTAPDAVVTLNNEALAERPLRNGDVIGAGLAKIQFSLAALPQRGLKVREIASWLLILAVAVAQIYCVVRLLAMARS
jgi:hypothetical protein